MEEPGIIISYDELRILLYNRGFRTCKGILMPDEERSDEEILQTMHKLSKRGMIENKGDYFVITKKIEQIVDLIGAPDSSYSFCGKEYGYVYYCYLSSELVVVTQNDPNRRETLILRSFTPEQFGIWREELDRE